MVSIIPSQDRENYQEYNEFDNHQNILRKVKLRSFDGSLDPKQFLDCLSIINQLLNQYDIKAVYNIFIVE